MTEHLVGETLLDAIIQRYPLVHPDPTDAELAEYVAWADGIFNRLDTAVDDVRSRGVRVGDLHPSNIMVTPDGDVAIVDFECCTTLDQMDPAALGAVGFQPPADLPADRVDDYVRSAVRLMVLMPIVPLTGLEPTKATALVDVAASELPVPPSTVKELRIGLQTTDDGVQPEDPGGAMFLTDPLDWPAIRESLVVGILRSASPNRDDRLFPGDPLQFTYGGATLAYAAAGVLLALVRATGAAPPELVEWLLRASQSDSGCRGSGLYDGPHGAALALDAVGARDAGLALARAAPTDAPSQSLGLFGGRSGIALNLLHFSEAGEDDRLRAAATRLGELVTAELLRPGSPQPGSRPGLFHGDTGSALLCLRLFASSQDERYLDAAERALRNDLASGTFLPDGTFHVRAGARRLIYLDGGSAGIGIVLAKYLQHRPAHDLVEILDAIRRGCRIPFVLQPGLFQGRAGLIAAAGVLLDDAEASEVQMAHVRRLGWYAIDHQGALHLPGTGLTKFSCDLATGSAWHLDGPAGRLRAPAPRTSIPVTDDGLRGKGVRGMADVLGLQGMGGGPPEAGGWCISVISLVTSAETQREQEREAGGWCISVISYVAAEGQAGQATSE